MDLGRPRPPFYEVTAAQFRQTMERIERTVGARYRRDHWADGTVYYLRAVPASAGWDRIGYEMRDGTCWLHAGIDPEPEGAEVSEEKCEHGIPRRFCTALHDDPCVLKEEQQRGFDCIVLPGYYRARVDAALDAARRHAQSVGPMHSAWDDISRVEELLRIGKTRHLSRAELDEILRLTPDLEKYGRGETP